LHLSECLAQVTDFVITLGVDGDIEMAAGDSLGSKSQFG
jgi:hypothetical protein